MSLFYSHVVEQHLDRHNAALRQALELCLDSDYPLSGLSECMATLRSDAAWEGVDLAEVEHAARRILRALLDPGTD